MLKNTLFATIMFLSLLGICQTEKIEIFYETQMGKLGADFDYHILWESKSVVLFENYDDAHGKEPWITDGTADGTHLLKDIDPGKDYYDDPLSSYPKAYAILGNYVYFNAHKTDYGWELWRTDGTTTGTEVAAHIHTDGGGLGSAESLFFYKNELYFAGENNIETGTELWKTNGTAEGTVLVKNINTTSKKSSYPHGFTIYNDLLYFIAESVNNHRELWVTNGTNTGTHKLDYAMHDELTGVEGLVVCNNLLFFKGYTETEGLELYRTNATSEGTFMLKDINTEGDGVNYTEQIIAYNNKVYFKGASIEFGAELWVSDGTADGTVMLKDINPGDGDYSALSSSPYRFTIFDNKLFFCAREEEHFQELWMTDGTEDGTFMFVDLNPNGHSFPNQLTVCNGRLYFEALYPDYYTLLSIGSSTEEPVAHYGDDFTYGSNSDFHQFFILNNNLHFTAKLDVTKGNQLYKLVEDTEKSITLSDTEITLLKDETKQLSASVEPTSSGDVIVWESLNDGVATVGEGGLVTAIYGGQTKIIASLQGTDIADTCTVTIMLPVEDVILTPENVNISIGGTEILHAVVMPLFYVVDKTISWKSIDETIATVSSSGLLTAVDGGTTKIIVTTNSGGFTDTCLVTVSGPNAIKNFRTDNISIYPNPTNNYLKIKGIETDFKTEIIGFDGKVYVHSSNNKSIDITCLKSGIYILKIYSDNNIIIHKFIKQ